MEDFENIYKKLKFGVKSSTSNSATIITPHQDDLLRLRVLPEEQEEGNVNPLDTKKRCLVINDQDKKIDEKQDNNEGKEFLSKYNLFPRLLFLKHITY